MSESRDFWSRRRAAVEAEQDTYAQAEIADAELAEQASLEAMDDAQILNELNLPDPDGLTLGDDIRGFMAKNVPERLRRRALRRLWGLNPVLANVDGLNDYDEDYTKIVTGPEGLQTTYQVGKGMLAHVQELARQAIAATEATSPPEDEAPSADEVIAQDDPTPDPPTQICAAAPDVTPETEPEGTLKMPRRMRFRFDSANASQRT